MNKFKVFRKSAAGKCSAVILFCLVMAKITANTDGTVSEVSVFFLVVAGVFSMLLPNCSTTR